MISDSVLSAKEEFDKPNFDAVFKSRNGNTGTKISFTNGVGVIESIPADVKKSLTKLFDYSLLTSFLSQENDIKEIFDYVNERYEYYKSQSRRTGDIKNADSFYLNLRKQISPAYSARYNAQKDEAEIKKEEAKDDQTKQAYDDFIKGLEAENGANIADLEKDKIVKGTIEGLLYVIPAIICIYLIIKKIRS
jgi:hypothetical protein